MPNQRTHHTSTNVTFENSITLMKYYQDEFQYRHAHYWNILFKMFAFFVIIIILPVTTEAMGVALSDNGRKFALIFPILGIIIAFLTRIILEDEAKKISAVNKAKYEINNTLPPIYQYRNYVEDKSNPKVQLAHKLVKLIFYLEIIMCGIIIVILYGEPALRFLNL